MKTLSEWLLSSPFSLNLQSNEDIKLGVRQPKGVLVNLLTEDKFTENRALYDFAFRIYGEVKSKTLYPMNDSGKEFFFIFPKDLPKSLGFDLPGKSHYLCYLGSLLSVSLLNHSNKNPEIKNYLLNFENNFIDNFSSIKYEFFVGFLQKSISNKLSKNYLQEEKISININDINFSPFDLNKSQSIHDSMCITRSFVNMPPNILNPQSYEDFLDFIIENEKKFFEEKAEIHMEVMSYEALKEQDCGLICAVGQGSLIKPRLVKLTYQPRNSSKKLPKISLVGKGITFDSGGYDIKPSSGMRIMKKDMGGSASAFGIFLSCLKLELPVHLTCWLPLAENMISGNAMRPGDVYRAKNGLQIEIDNTDAEGRLVLADALTLAIQESPDWLIDLATLTGAARVSLGTMVDSLFGNHKFTTELLYRSGIETGDWVWNIPIPADYESYLDSNISDLANSGSSGFAGSITAALFLQKFIGNTQWNHIDTYMWCDKPTFLWSEGSGATGKCVRLVTRAIEEYILNL
ncbi:M17 family metallopeptidase [Pigmentibacter sp. JX0631]|uniref:leucyl aminopeptidase family protein n=1 Tax=Pigmentibacter sp. JX0631 TaxID=2976982 RepID=UPI002468BA7A|nr:M17 family metallopeptidase [Pigmentibacter sp. JX0631]WGL60309.1 M17 family metallopeptidase [Pigmentibacter sp. JX0631]